MNHDAAEACTVVDMHTPCGLLQLELYDAAAPLLCESFRRLASSGQLTGRVFTRAVPGCLLLGETPRPPLGLLLPSGFALAEGGEKTVNTAAALSSPVLRHTGAGILTCAWLPGRPPAAAFALTLSPQPKLDGVYGVFGRVRRGMQLVAAVAAGHSAPPDGTLEEPLVVTHVYVKSETVRSDADGSGLTAVTRPPGALPVSQQSSASASSAAVVPSSAA